MNANAMTPQERLQKLQALKELRLHEAKLKAPDSLIDFIKYTMPTYEAAWFHKYMCNEKLQKFINGEIKRLMVFMPPQHGKSEITSRRYPAYQLGKDPNCRIVGCSYAHSLASKFNRSVQRIIDTPEYQDIFPETTLNRSNVRTVAKGNYLRNSDEFEIVGYDGSYLSVGVGGALTGNPADVVVIDDPIKDAAEAKSEKVRDNIWEWYTSVVETRIHNDSRILITLTRWHEDDLAGRLLLHEPDEWDVVRFPAIKENDENKIDPRNVGEALWPTRHNKESLMNRKKKSERTFTALYQQRPSPQEGDMFKRSWFVVKKRGELQDIIKEATIDVWIDGAYTEKLENDPTALMATFMYNGQMYVLNSTRKRMEMYELLKYFPKWADEIGLNHKSRVYIEPKASGKSLRSMLNKAGYNAIEIPTKQANAGKISRANDTQPSVEAGKVVLVEGWWNESLLEECAVFPNGTHDDQVDNLCYAVLKYFVKKRKAIY